MLAEETEVTMDSALHLMDELSMRLSYYKEIKKFRKKLREEASRNKSTIRAQMFDINMKVKYQKETKEYDLMERNSKEVLMLLNKIKEELA